jgi:hypothetical protein
MVILPATADIALAVVCPNGTFSAPLLNYTLESATVQAATCEPHHGRQSREVITPSATCSSAWPPWIDPADRRQGVMPATAIRRKG